MASNYTYSFFRVSKTDGVGASAQRYRDLRLKALKTSPNSFSSTYDIESAFTDGDWIDRLTLPDRELFICAATPLSHDSSSDEIQWIGQVTLRGPSSRADFELPVEAGQPSQKSDEEEERWQMLSLFTLAEYRGHGLGSKLCQEAINYLRSYRSFPRQVQVRLIVKAGNHVTVELYRRLGFIHAGKATLVEALIANGDEHLVPKDLASEKYSERKGLIMISRISRS
ncbi:Acyl-CoA N-acyltransferase [Penicillium cf. griseofulvum]|uniref:Acyl-CoA N-acyltransferase n=1 Tax=Penicillium cf. griseofulvum TaxID=2972120 RepID=A0A9W9JL42_9EURO|nr:Acyl-CoA N-acyltransferase [Penicillium cf. griseofulvum]KAJ5443209.1 Acyl-CoA N-acyltransferase [Penicillium cf. griseofulvum]KAJ5451337.1 Acyl-CoA N-acyltransferase [Penicillium cf. griseofulvum]